MLYRTVAIFLLLLFPYESDARKKALEPRNSIEDVDFKRLEELIESESFLAVFFYSKVCKECEKFLTEIEKIDDDAENFGLQFVKNGEKFVAKRYGVTEFPTLVYFRNKEPAIYKGDLMNEDNVLEWLTDIESMELPDVIEEVNAKVLENLIDETEFVAVIFYKNDCPECESVLHELEQIDEEADKSNIAIVKVRDEVLALEFGIENLPALLYYRRKVPLLYDGNLHDEKLVLNWLEAHKDLEADIIEDISSNILSTLIENSTFLAVLFYDKNDEKCQEILLELESIDDDASKHGIPFVKISDLEAASSYGIVELPALVYFEKKVPNFFQGDLHNEEEVLQYLIHQKESDEIEDVTNKVLARMIKTSDCLAVLFYDSGSNTSKAILDELEGIDDDCDRNNVPFVKIDDSQLESLYGIKNPPALAFYKKQVPKFYDGDLSNEENVLQWLLKQMSSEEIEDVSTPVLQQMIKNTEYLSVLFYDKSEKSAKVIKELENIDDEADQRNLPFVKIADDELAKYYGIDDELPILVYFEGEIPSIYRGDLTNEEEVLDYLVKQMEADEIEEVTDRLLEIMINKHSLLAVLFYDASSDSQVINELEKIDDEADQQGILFLKTSDLAAAEKYGIEYLPSLVFFYKKMPNVYSGDLHEEEEVLKWFVDQLTKDEIEDVTEKMLLHLIETSPTLAVLFYDADSPKSFTVLKELEQIDDDLEKYDIPFVKISDVSLAQQFGLNDELPILLFFEDKIPSIFEGDLMKEEEVLDWLVKQKTEDSIEEVTEEILLKLMKDRGYVLAFFAPNECEICETILHELENIDDETDENGILLVTTDDMNVAISKANVTEFPALVLFRNEEPVPYTGDLMDEAAILAWVTSEETLDSPDVIEEVNERMLDKMLNVSHSLCALFYHKTGCSECEIVLQRLENIDDDAEKNEVDFVKISDPALAEKYNVTTFPTIIFFRRQVPQLYEGDLRQTEEILKWLIENRDRPDSFIEDVDRKQLEVLIEEQTVAVFFYNENCSTCEAILQELEHIDDDSDRYGVQILKTDDMEFGMELGVSEVPSFVYFENSGIPSIYDGDLMNEDDILQFLVQEKTEDTIANINRDMLFKLIEEQEYLAIYFYKENDRESKEILKHLEQIDDDCSDYEVQLLKMSDNLMAKKYRVRNPPGLVFFRHGNPITYPGDLMDEEEVLEFLTSPDNMESSDAIEKVNRRMLERVLARCDYLAVFFYRRTHCRKCDKALEELENIDDDAESQGIHFVKIEDEKLGRSFGVFNMPALVFFRFGDTEDPVVYAGDLKNGSDILDWLVTQKDPSSDMIEEMEGDELEDLIESANFLAVLFYDPDEEDCPECQETLADLENIDDDTDRHGILFVKTSDDSIAANYGITKFPALIYFENNVPSIYEGDISAEEEVLQSLIHSKSEDTIETVNKNICDKLIEDTPYLVVVFYKLQNKVSDEILEHLENIDGFTDEFGIQMVKTQDSTVGRRYGIKQFPALVYFRNGHPLVYKGDLKAEELVLDWILSDNTIQLAEEIEEVNAKMLDKLVEKFQLLAVYFYEKECDECIDILKDLEEIDEEADLFGIGFVKNSESSAAVQWGVHSVPTLAYFRKSVPVFYEGSLNDPERVLNWLTSQDMIELKNEIEEVSRKMLDKLLYENDFIAIFFYDEDCPACEDALRALEEIDHEIDELDILFVKIKDARYARKYGMKNLPSLTYFRKRFPTMYHGNLTDTAEVLNWLKKNRYRSRELNLFMFSIIAMGAVFIQYTCFLKFCFGPMVEKQS